LFTPGFQPEKNFPRRSSPRPDATSRFFTAAGGLLVFALAAGIAVNGSIHRTAPGYNFVKQFVMHGSTRRAAGRANLPAWRANISRSVFPGKRAVGDARIECREPRFAERLFQINFFPDTTERANADPKSSG